jgi:phosphatidyl-myo-inositol alpha-mannosyltransferase
VRIALVSPYSWTYPGGVTRHIEALSHQLRANGHEAHILAPFDPEDTLSRRLHRGAAPEPREVPENLVSLGRTVGLRANGAVSNIALTPHAIYTLRKHLRSGRYDLVHVHEPVVPVLGWEALGCADGLALVGTFHTYSENALTNGIACVVGARLRMNRLHIRIAVSEAAAWTARRFFGGRYKIIPNGVHIPGGQGAAIGPHDCGGSLRILFIGQAVERKGLPIVLRAFEALREQVPATLTLVGAGPEQVAPLLLDGRGVHALGNVSEERKAIELERAQVLCAPSLGGESFGMVLTEAFAAGTPVVASDIAGYRDVVRDGVDGWLIPREDALALAQALRALALDPTRRASMALAARERAQRFAWPHVASEVLECYEQAIVTPMPAGRLHRGALRLGLAPADLQPRIPAKRLPSLEPAAERGSARRALQLASRLALALVSVVGVCLAVLALRVIGIGRVLASLLSSSPTLLAVGLGLMCASMFARGVAWHTILKAAPTWRLATLKDALQGTFIGVLMSATLPARLGEPSRALVVARRLGRAMETLPIVLGTMVSQTLLNLLALGILGAVMLSSVNVFDGHSQAMIAIALAPAAALAAVLLAPALVPSETDSRSGRLRRLMVDFRATILSVRQGLRVFRAPRQAVFAGGAQLGAWGMQWISCWFLLMALGLDRRAGIGGAAAVLFAVNVTALIPATPANVGVFQAACVAVLVGGYHVPASDALAYGIILQAVEVSAALLMGMPALLAEGLSWKEIRLRTMHAAPVRLPVAGGGHAIAGSSSASVAPSGGSLSSRSANSDGSRLEPRMRSSGEPFASRRP